MRLRIRAMREALVRRLRAAGVKRDMGFIHRQKGMFSYSGLNTAQMQRLRSEFGVYGVDSGRICVAALNERNIGPVVAAIAKVACDPRRPDGVTLGDADGLMQVNSPGRRPRCFPAQRTVCRGAGTSGGP